MARAKLDQTRLAKKVGVSRQTVGTWLAGTWPSSEYAAGLAAALGSNVQYLITGQGPSGPIGETPDLERARREGFELAIARVRGMLDDLLVATSSTEVRETQELLRHVEAAEGHHPQPLEPSQPKAAQR